MSSERADFLAFAQAHPTGIWRDIVRAAYNLSADVDVLDWLNTHDFDPVTMRTAGERAIGQARRNTFERDPVIAVPLNVAATLPAMARYTGRATWNIDTTFNVDVSGYLAEDGDGSIVLDQEELEADLESLIFAEVQERVTEDSYDDLETEDQDEVEVDYDSEPQICGRLRVLVASAMASVLETLQEEYGNDLVVN